MKTNNLKEFNSFAKDLAKKIKKEKIQVVGLVGDLGAGKTTLVRQILRELGVSASVTSPSFVLIKPYRHHIYHIDCYRLEDPKEILWLGLNDLLKNKNNLLLIEWADRIKDLLPKETLWVNISHTKNNEERVIELKQG